MTRKLLFSLSVLSFFYGCKDDKSIELSSFTSDGCSLFIDGTFENPELWKECCLKHDIAYWRGGTEKEREAADIAFKNCVKKKTGNSKLAEIMYQAVRKGGEPYYPTWYRWGYGWPLGRGYKELSEEELGLVEKKLEAYNLSQPKKDI
jgi:hypothetical protein